MLYLDKVRAQPVQLGFTAREGEVLLHVQMVKLRTLVLLPPQVAILVPQGLIAGVVSKLSVWLVLTVELVNQFARIVLWEPLNRKEVKFRV